MWFPNPNLAADEGLLAVGGDLTMERLLAAYREGVFPWTDNPVSWWSPNPRSIIELDKFHVSASLAKTTRRCPFDVTVDRAFQEVMQGCAEPGPGRGSSWITANFIAAYTRLHQHGHAHSVECWRQGVLVGGVYGVAIGGFFAGESMFHRASHASKVALLYLLQHLRHKGFALFDTQIMSPVSRSFGAREISRSEYLERLAIALDYCGCRF